MGQLWWSGVKESPRISTRAFIKFQADDIVLLVRDDDDLGMNKVSLKIEVTLKAVKGSKLGYSCVRAGLPLGHRITVRF